MNTETTNPLRPEPIREFLVSAFIGSMEQLSSFMALPRRISRFRRGLWERRQGGNSSDLPGGVSATFSSDKKTIRLLRYSGLQNPARMMGGNGGNSLGMGMGRGRQNLLPPGTPDAQAPLTLPGPLSGLGGSYFIWMEYSTSSPQRGKAAILPCGGHDHGGAHQPLRCSHFRFQAQ